jgi:hypothetical protein
MRTFLLLASLLFAFSGVAAQQHNDWQEFRSEADGFSIEMPAAPKTTTRDLGNGGTQKMFQVDAGQETYLVSVIELAAGTVPRNPDEAYFTVLLKAYIDGSTTTLRSSRMTTWAGHTAIEGVSDIASTTHLINITAAGDRIYLAVYAGAKGQEAAPKATRMRDSFKLLAK